MVARLFSILGLAVILSGCTVASAVDIIAREMAREPLNIDHPDAVKLKPIVWHAITEENYKEIFDQLKAQGYDPVLFGLTDEGYEDLSLNFAEIRKFIILQRKILEKYKEYYEGKDGTHKKP